MNAGADVSVPSAAVAEEKVDAKGQQSCANAQDKSEHTTGAREAAATRPLARKEAARDRLQRRNWSGNCTGLDGLDHAINERRRSHKPEVLVGPPLLEEDVLVRRSAEIREDFLRVSRRACCILGGHYEGEWNSSDPA